MSLEHGYEWQNIYPSLSNRLSAGHKGGVLVTVPFRASLGLELKGDVEGTRFRRKHYLGTQPK